MQRLEVSCAVRLIYTSLGAKGLMQSRRQRCLCTGSRNFTDRAVQNHSRLPDPYQLAGNLPGRFLRTTSAVSDMVRRNGTDLKSPSTIFMLCISTTDRAGSYMGHIQDILDFQYTPDYRFHWGAPLHVSSVVSPELQIGHNRIVNFLNVQYGNNLHIGRYRICN